MIGTLQPDEIETVLRSQVVGRIGMCADGRAYVVPLSYVYDGTAIYAHSYEGLKLRMMRASPEVCFQVDEMSDLANWRSVIAWGAFEELAADRAVPAIELLSARLSPLTSSENAGAAGRTRGRGGHGGVAFRIVVTERTGRYEKR